jgi:hypothetical protein
MLIPAASNSASAPPPTTCKVLSLIEAAVMVFLLRAIALIDVAHCTTSPTKRGQTAAVDASDRKGVAASPNRGMPQRATPAGSGAGAHKNRRQAG